MNNRVAFGSFKLKVNRLAVLGGHHRKVLLLPLPLEVLFQQVFALRRFLPPFGGLQKSLWEAAKC